MKAAKSWAILVVSGLGMASPGWGQEAVSEEVVGPIHSRRQYVTLSEDGLHYAYMTMDRERGGIFIVCDGKEGPIYKRLGKDLVFSPDGRHFGHDAHSDEGSFYVIDGKAIGPFENTRGQTIRFGPEGKRLIYFVKREGKWRLVVDGQEQAPLSDAYAKGSPLLSPDGKRVAYHAALGEWEGGEHFVVVDGAEDPHYEAISGLSFSADSRHVMYKAKKGDKWRVVYDGQEGPEFGGIRSGDPAFGPQGKHWAYVASPGPWDEGKRIIVLDGVVSRVYEGIGKSSPVFSADGKRVAYFAKQGGKWQLVLDGREEGLQWGSFAAGSPVFSPDGRRVAYHASRGAWEETGHVVVVDGVAGPEYDKVSGPFFSPDGKRVAYRGKRGDKWHVVLDGEEGGGYDDIAKGHPLFSPDSKRTGYHACVGEWEGGEHFMVIDGVEGPRYDSVYGLRFSPDSQRVAYKAKRGEATLAIIDGEESEEYGGMGANHPIFSPDSQHVAYEGSRGPWEDGDHVLVMDGEVVMEGVWLRRDSPAYSADGKRVVYAVRRGEKRFVVLDGQSGPEYDDVMTHPPRFTGEGAVRYLAVREGQLLRVTQRVVEGE